MYELLLPTNQLKDFLETKFIYKTLFRRTSTPLFQQIILQNTFGLIIASSVFIGSHRVRLVLSFFFYIKHKIIHLASTICGLKNRDKTLRANLMVNPDFMVRDLLS